MHHTREGKITDYTASEQQQTCDISLRQIGQSLIWVPHFKQQQQCPQGTITQSISPSKQTTQSFSPPSSSSPPLLSASLVVEVRRTIERPPPLPSASFMPLPLSVPAAAAPTVSASIFGGIGGAGGCCLGGGIGGVLSSSAAKGFQLHPWVAAGDRSQSM